MSASSSYEDFAHRLKGKLLPNDGHGLGAYAVKRSWDYRVTHLLEEEPPEGFPLSYGGE